MLVHETELESERSNELKMLPTACFILWIITFVSIGAYALTEDTALKSDATCERFHMWKYVLLNTVLQCFVFLTYFVIAGGGEGARARAMVCVLFHFGFAVWGVLLWTRLDTTCETILQEQFRAVYAFYHICVISNFINFGLFLLHEVYLGPKIGVDLTLMPEIHYSIMHRPSAEGLPRLNEAGPAEEGFFPHAPPGLVKFPDQTASEPSTIPQTPEETSAYNP
jgi:hypothetical protein